MIDSPETATACSCAMLRRASRVLTQRYDQALRPLGLKLTQYSLLANLDRAGPVSITELARLLVLDRTTLTRNLDTLEKTSLVAIGPGRDRRSREVTLTRRGRALYRRARPQWQRAERRFRRSLGTADAAQLRSLLDAVLDKA